MSTSSGLPLAQPNISSNLPSKRKAMSITQTYYLAHTARSKLSSEAARADHNLRLLVGHANLLDSLMLDLAAAEQEQESWFNQSVTKASKSSSKLSQHIHWADGGGEEPEEDWAAEDADDSSDSDSEDDEDEEVDVEMAPVSVRRTMITAHQLADEEQYEDEEGDVSLQLTHTVLHSESHVAHLPELDHDSDSSEDESMPPSPPSDTLPSFSEKQQIATTSFYSSKSTPSIPESEQQAFFDNGFYLPQRTSPSLISHISVY